jgi:D-alanyl-lipoteichoic acid acyltransferase DltB (MBOAT superfamily)
MVFHSFAFILCFLPLSYLGYLLAFRLAGWTGAFRFLVAASLIFYAQFSVALALVLIASVVGNYLLGNAIFALAARRSCARWVLLGGIAANIGALVYFKYANFLVDIINVTAGSEFSHIHLLMPVGVSFYTFVQIGYLVEAYNGQVERPDLSRYALFAAFLPCVTAGPLMLQKEMLDQMRHRKDRAFCSQRLALAVSIFAIGLFKKVFLADSIAPFADTVFDGVGKDASVSALVAWIGATSYALQLYFDFSGYSDMALGIGLLFGLRLPLNFDSPFKATNISDFWRRWHMTMTRFFTMFIYTPLAIKGLRSARARGAGPLERCILTGALPAIVTFLIAGIWHGAGWTFVVYGLIHGFALAVHHLWKEMKLPLPPTALAWLLTMSVVVSGLVVFRAPSLGVALALLGPMWGTQLLGPSAAAGAAVALDLRTALSMIVVLGSIVLLMPNSQQILHRGWFSSDLMPDAVRAAAGPLVWRPSIATSIALAVTLCVALASIGSGSSFVYYQF